MKDKTTDIEDTPSQPKLSEGLCVESIQEVRKLMRDFKPEKMRSLR
jgi:hypothetical protein